MKRREFIQAGICLGCAGALGFGIYNKLLSDKELLSCEKFMYKDESELPRK